MSIPMHCYRSIVRGAAAEELRLAALTQNLANANTVAYKEDRLTLGGGAAIRDRSQGSLRSFLSYLAAAQGEGALETARLKINYSQGPLQHTGNPLDLALNGPGFFVIKTPEGERYTRQGNFVLGPNRVLATSAGFPVLGERGEILLPAGSIRIGEDGRILDKGVDVGKLKIVNFSSPQGLQKVEGGLYETSKSENPPQEVKGTQVKQGYVEGSNVNIVRDLVSMLETLRLYESYQKILQTLNEIDAQANTQVGRTS